MNIVLYLKFINVINIYIYIYIYIYIITVILYNDITDLNTGNYTE